MTQKKPRKPNPRTLARQRALQALYQWRIGSQSLTLIEQQFFEEEECLVCHNTRQVPDTDHEDSGSGISEDEVMKDCECKIRRDEKIRLAMMTNMSIIDV